MTLEDEKRLVATRLMGWKWILFDGDQILFKGGDKKNEDNYINLEDGFNPQDNDKATCKEWAEIWDKMDSEIARKYLCELQSRIIIVGNYWEIHIAKPEICWEALISALEAK